MTSHMDTAAATTTTRNGDDTRGCVSDDRASPQCVAGKNGGSAVSIYRTSSRSPTPPPASDSLSNLHRVTDMLKDKLNGTTNNNNNNTASTTTSATPSTPTTSLDLSSENTGSGGGGGGSSKRKAYSGAGSKQVNGCSGSYSSSNSNNNGNSVGSAGNGRSTPTSTSTATTGATNNNKMDAFSMAAAAAAAAAAAQQQMSMLLNNDLYGTDSNVLRGILQGNDRMLDSDAKLAASGKLYSDLYKNHMTGSESGDSFRSASPGNASFDSDQANGDLTDNRDDEDSTMTSLPRDDGYLDDESTNNAKRLRVDGTNGGSDGSGGGVLSVPNPTGMSTLTERRPKRKQYIPQQHGCLEPSQKVSRLDRQLLQKQLRQMQQQLSLMQQRYCELFEQGDTSDLSDGDSTGRPDTPEGNRLTSDLDYDVIKSASRSMTSEFGCKTSSDDIDSLAKVLKAEITHRVGSLVDAVVAQFVQKQQHHQQQQQHEQQQKQSQQQEQKGFRRTPSPTPSAVKAIKDRPPSVEETSASSKPHGTNTNNNNNSSGGNNNNNNVVKEGMPPGGGVGKLSESCGAAKPPRTKVTDKLSHPLFDFHQKPFGDLLRAHPALFPPPPYFPAQIPPIQPLYAKEPEQTEALALVVGTPTKKKRTKVTDTRLSPRAARALLQENMAHGGPAAGAGGPYDGSKHGPHTPHLGHHGSDPFQPPPPHPHPPLIPISLPTSVAIPNPSLQHSDILAMYSSHNGDSPFVDGGSARRAHSPSCSGSPNLGHTPIEALHHQLKAECDSYDHMMQESYGYDGSMAVTSTLTPMHLRKAKLMFFYTRYPSSSILKIYFPDVKFNKNNTAQLVKWFSNFREFYYIQMEKYARQALAEGVKNAEDLVVTTDSELYRILNLHYNRNNQIEVPDAFRVVVQATLREFFRSIQAGKDAEQSWKKAIYKVIARMDDTLPEYFKSPNWMEQLNDG